MKARRRRARPVERPLGGNVTEHFTREGRAKVAYRTDSEARIAAQASWAINGVDLTTYRCSHCHQWHMGQRFSRD
jgi:hypothetical protein